MRLKITTRQWIGLLLVAIACGIVYSWSVLRHPPIPQRPLRIGYESNPPFQMKIKDGFGGFAVETVNEAAKRTGIRLEWIETGTSSDEAFEKGLVDLWPLMGDLPERRKRLHLTRPWLLGNHILLTLGDAKPPRADFAGPIGVFNLPLHVRLTHQQYPNAKVTRYLD